MKKTSIIEGIKDYLDEEIIPFSMPGHKMGRGLKDIKEILIKGDLTEVDGLDNLQSPEGIIKEAENKLSTLYKSNKSYFLINGSTCGNLIMIFASFNEGDKVLVERNCHKSIMNGIILRKLNPIFIKNKFNNKIKAPIGLDINHLKEILQCHDDIKGIVLTYPNYYGIGLEINNIVEMCKNTGLKVLFDSAHGAHLGFNKLLPKSAQDLNGDMVVMSAHKTLPSLTQTAWLHVNNKELIEKVEFYKNIFMSTSPSYMMLMSLDYARYFLEVYAEKSYDELLQNIKELKNKVQNLTFGKIVDKHYLKDNYINTESLYLDESRIIINLYDGYNGNKLADYLRLNKIQYEMSDNKNVVLIPSTYNTKEDFYILAECLLQCNEDILKDNDIDFYEVEIPETKILPYKVVEMDKEYVLFEKGVGRIVGENIIPYPPGVPMLIMGELIEKKHIKLIKNYLKNNITIIGLDNKKIKVLKNN